MDNLKLLENIYKQWVIATKYDPSGNSVNAASEGNWEAWRAKESLKDDPTGLLTIIRFRGAYQKWVREHKLSVEEAMLAVEGLDEQFNQLRVLKTLVLEGQCKEIWEQFLISIQRIYKGLNIEVTIDELEKIKDIEKVIAKSFEDFNKDWSGTQSTSFIHEKFTEGKMKKSNPLISSKLFRFSSLEKLVNELKYTSQDNFICLALLDRIVEEDKTEEGANDGNLCYAFGVKNNGVIYVVSDRANYDTPKGASYRNPYKAVEYRWNYGNMPYNEAIKGNLKERLVNNTQLLLTSSQQPDEQKTETLKDLMKESSVLYIALMFYQCCKKYFIDVEDKKEKVYFGNQVKLLPPSSSKALTIYDDKVELPILPVYNKEELKEFLSGEDTIEAADYWDSFIKRYPLPEEECKTVSLTTSFIGTIKQAKKWSWWELRKRYRDYITLKLKEESDIVHLKTKEWFYDLLINNIDTVIDFILKVKDHKRVKYEGKHKVFEWGKTFEYTPQYSVKISDYVKSSWSDSQITYNAKDRWNKKLTTNKYGNFSYRYYQEEVNKDYSFYHLDGANSLTCRLLVEFNGWEELCMIFGLKEKPEFLKDNFYTDKREEPGYQGNNIISFTDPMNEIQDPFKKMFKYEIDFWFSKSYLNKLLKENK